MTIFLYGAETAASLQVTCPPSAYWQCATHTTGQHPLEQLVEKSSIMRSLPFISAQISIFLNTGLFVGFSVGIFDSSDYYRIDFQLNYKEYGALLRHQSPSQIPSCKERTGVKSGATGGNWRTGRRRQLRAGERLRLQGGYRTCLGPSASKEALKFAIKHYRRTRWAFYTTHVSHVPHLGAIHPRGRLSPFADG